MAKAVDGENGIKGRGMLATAISDDISSEENSKATTPSGKKPKSSFSDSAGSSHFHRLLRLRTERAMAPFTGGASFSSQGSGASRPGSAKVGGSNARPSPPEVKMIINSQRGSPMPVTRKRVAYM